MSKKKTSKRLEHIFHDIAPEESAPVKRIRKQSEKQPEALTPAQSPTPTRARSGIRPKPASPRLEEQIAPAVTSAVSSNSGAMSLAFRTDEKSWATLRVVDETEPRAWAMEEQMLVKQVADQLSLALENARLFQETQKALSETESLYEASAELNEAQSFDEIFEILRKRTTLNRASLGRLMQFDRPWNDQQIPQTVQLVADWPLEASNPSQRAARLSVQNFPALKFLSPREPTILEDAETDERLDKNSRNLIVNQFHAKSALFAPLTLGKDWIGYLVAYYLERTQFSKDELQHLMSLIQQASIAIEKTRLFGEAQRRAQEMSALAEVGQDVSASLDLQVVLERIATHAKNLLNGLSSAVYLPDPDGKTYRAIAVIGSDAEEIKKDPIRLGEGILGNVAKTGDGEIVNDALRDQRALTIQGTNQLPNEHLMATPLLSGNRVSGIMAVWRTGAGIEFSQGELELLNGLARQAAIAVENARLFESTRASQQAVERSEGELRALFAAMTDVIIILDKDGRYLRIAPTNPSRLIRTPDELVGQLTEDVLPKEAAHSVMNGIEQALRSGETVDLEYMLDISQKEYWFDATISKLSEEQVFLVARDITERKFNEMLQTAVTQIAEAALSAPDIAGLTKIIHENVNTLMPARNFYISLYDERTDLMTFPYYADEHDSAFPPQKPGRGLTSYVLRTGKPLLVTPEVFDDLEKSGEITSSGTRGVDWMGVPLRSGSQRIGVMAVQTYDLKVRLSEKDLETLNLIASQTAIAIERKRSQEELSKFKLGLDQSDDAVFITDTDGTILYANPGFEKVYGYKPEEALGKNPRIIKSGIMTQEQYKLFWETLLSKNTSSGEVINKSKDGRLIPIAGTNSPILNEAGNIIGFLAIHKDMTATKRAEEALQRRNDYLAAAAEIGRLVTSTLDLNTIFSRTVNLVSERFGYYHAAIFVVEETGFNAILREATGEAGAEMKRLQHSLPVNEHSIVGKATQTGEVVVVNNTALDLTHKTNPLLPETQAEAAIPLRVGTRIIGALDIQSTTIESFISDDLAVLQLLADQVAIAIDNARSYELSQQAVMEMREVDHMKSMFLANMSHELRTPLNSIIGFSRVILKGIDGPVSELQQQDLTAIYNSGQHLLGLINDILDLSKIEAGKMELAFDEVNITDLINGVMSTVMGLVKDKPVKLVKNIQENLPTVRADAIRVRQVLLNLLSNASKFTSEGSITVEATVGTGPAGHPEILVSVTDTGPGIEAKDQAKLFQPFSQVDDSLTRRTGGTGLGLSISQQLIQMHGGRIGLHSVIGKGSTFYFTLPIYRGKEETSTSNDGKVILAIDDDPQVISLYERYLQPQGYQVVPLTDPNQAIERAKQLKPYAITLDIMMPGYDGWSVLNDLKADGETRDVPVIICSIIEDQERGFSLGAADYLLKPILEDDLLNALDHLNSDGSIREVLVVDDNPSDLRLMDKILKEHGRYKTILAEGGRKGWEAVLSQSPHAVILDLFMPEMDGFTILEKMRENPKLRDIPVIVVSGVDLSNEQQQQLKEFGQRLLSKGALNESDLLSTIERALKRVDGKK
ncbi:MAG TPA: GAF domain-containing protein [Anaerolineales bacterium]